MQEIKIFVLCAGEGKRLRPYTETQPKCLVPYLGKPLLQYQLEVFKQFNLKNITLIGGYRNDALPKQYPVVINKEFATTNMLYSLFCAEEQMTDVGDVIVSYGDIIYHASVLEKLLQSDHPCDVVTDIAWRHYWQERMEDPLKDAETFRWDVQTHRIFELGKKPSALEDIQGQYIGLFKISSAHIRTFKQHYETFKSSNPNYKNAYMTDFLQYLIEQNFSLFGVPIQNHWAEFDTVEDLKIKLAWM